MATFFGMLVGGPWSVVCEPRLRCLFLPESLTYVRFFVAGVICEVDIAPLPSRCGISGSPFIVASPFSAVLADGFVL
jgi:hypothetical protein